MSSVAPIGIAIAGAAGRMGRALIQELQKSSAVCLQGALVSPRSPWVGQAVGQREGAGSPTVIFTASLAEALAEAAVLIDFTTPTATLQHVEYCCQHGKALVIGTTGLAASTQRQIRQVAQQIAILQAANFSVGIHLLYQLAAQAAQILGQESDIDIFEKHHRHKRDAPSGTALALGEQVANSAGLAWPACRGAVTADLSKARAPNTIQFASVRAGEGVGEHSISFTTAEEQLTITHQASSRRAFAQGALRAAQWLVHQPAAYYTLQDLLQSTASNQATGLAGYP